MRTILDTLATAISGPYFIAALVLLVVIATATAIFLVLNLSPRETPSQFDTSEAHLTPTRRALLAAGEADVVYERMRRDLEARQRVARNDIVHARLAVDLPNRYT